MLANKIMRIAKPPLSAQALTRMAATATTSGGAPRLSHTSSHHRRLNPTKKLNGSTKFLTHVPTHSSMSRQQLPFTVQASNDPQMQDRESTTDSNTAASTSQEDLNFLWKLGAGSFVVAAVIKYGSILFPEITRPNLLQALVMILTPVVVAVWLLIKQSRAEKQS